MAAGSPSVFSLPTYNVKVYVTVSLDHSNFLTWQRQMTTFLRFNGLLGYVDGTLSAPKPASSSSTESSSAVSSSAKSSLDEWQKFDSFVTACITATLSDSLVHHSLEYESAHELWTALKESFLQQSMARKSLIRSQLRTLKKGSLSIAEFLHQVRYLSSSLAAIGDPLPDAELVLITLEGLPRSYHPFITSVENLAAPPSFSQLRAKLLTYEQRLAFDGDEVPSADSISTIALTAKLQSSSLQDQALHMNVHSQPTSNIAPSKSNSAPVQSSSGYKGGYKGKCQICRRHGHSAMRCRLCYSPPQSPYPPQQFAGFHSQPSSMPPLLPTPPPNTWIPDSGATSHMTPDPTVFQNLQPYTESDSVVVGDGPSNRDPPPQRPS